MIDGRKVRALRLKKKWSQWELAVAANLHASRVCNIECNKDQNINYTVRICRQLANALGVSIEEILFDGEK
jgi:transcriptional regulator with XRE-family HTH domain